MLALLVAAQTMPNLVKRHSVCDRATDRGDVDFADFMNRVAAPLGREAAYPVIQAKPFDVAAHAFAGNRSHPASYVSPQSEIRGRGKLPTAVRCC